MLIICRFMGMAMTVPSTAMKNVHPMSVGQAMWWPWTRSIAQMPTW